MTRDERINIVDKMKNWIPQWIAPKSLVKSVTPYFVATLWLQIPWTRHIISTSHHHSLFLVLLPASILWNDCVKTVGAMILSTILFICTVTSCTIFSWTCLVKVQPNSLALMILLYMLMIGIIAAFKAKYPKHYTASANVGISLLVFQITNGHYDYSLSGQVRVDRIFLYYQACLLGVFLSFISSLCIFPIWANSQSKKGLVDTLRSIRSILELIQESISGTALNSTHTQEHDLKNRINAMDSSVQKWSSAIDESKFEPRLCHSHTLTQLHHHVPKLLRSLELVCTSCKFLLQHSQSTFVPVLEGWMVRMRQTTDELCKYCQDQILLLLDSLISEDSIQSIAIQSNVSLLGHTSPLLSSRETSLESILAAFYRQLDDHINLTHITECSSFHVSLLDRDIRQLEPSIPERSCLEQVMLVHQFYLSLGRFISIWNHCICDEEYDRDNNTEMRYNTTENDIFSVGWFYYLMSVVFNLYSAFFLRKDVQFAVRMSIITTFWTLFSMFDDTRDLFHQWRCQWAVITMAVVMTPTVGGAFRLGLYRILGTIAGGLWACLTWILYVNDLLHYHSCPNISISVMTLLWSIPCLALRQHPKMRRLGTVSLMSFTVVLYTTYLNSLHGHWGTGDAKFSVYWIAIARCTMIIVGVILSILSSAFIFPTFSRTLLRKEAAMLIEQLHLSFINVVNNSSIEEYQERQIYQRLDQCRYWYSLCESEWKFRLTRRLKALSAINTNITIDDDPRSQESLYKELIDGLQDWFERLMLFYLFKTGVRYHINGDSQLVKLIDQIQLVLHTMSCSLWSNWPSPITICTHLNHSEYSSVYELDNTNSLWIQLALHSLVQELCKLESLQTSILKCMTTM